MPTSRRIGRKLKQARQATGLSQTELATKAGVSRAYVFRLEAGGADPTVGILQKLAKALGVPVTDLLS
jgi:XRE family transcriptional regulator, regulator of sulfur utilization